MKKTRTQILTIILILSAAFLGMTSLTRPEIVPASAPATDFSAERAMEHVSAISQAPHPPGSEEIERVRAYIIRRLEELGLSPEIQDTIVAVPQWSGVIGSTVKNISAVIPGINSSKTILLDAHYDTRAMTPGASDCGSCVATLLETTRALLAGLPLQNDVILLFTDNEEYGAGLGAAAFLDEYAKVDEIGLVLNFEGLGSTGPAILFETGPNTGWAVRDWGRVASHPVGQSWFYEVYRLTPIGTDLNWFSEAGVPGMNFGHWAEGTVYHSKRDNPQTIDPRSLQHHGSYALALTRHLGNRDLNAARSSDGNAVYFSLIPGLLISYPTAWTIPLAILAGLLLVGIGVMGFRRKQITIRGTLKGLGGFLLSLVVSTGLATGLWMGATHLHSEYQAMLTFRGMLYNTQFYVFGFVALAIAIAAAIVGWLRHKTTVMDLTFGALLLFWLLTLTTSILLPGFSYLFTWSLLFSSLALGWVLWKPSPAGDNQRVNIILMVGALPGVILFAPSIYVMYHFALAPMVGILALMVALLLGTLIPQVDLLIQSHKWRLSGLALVVCVVFLIIGSLTASFDSDHPRPNAVAYLLNTDTETATWFSGGVLQDTWTSQFFLSEPEYGAIGDMFPIETGNGFPIMWGKAPVIALESPKLEIISDKISGSVRTVQLNLKSLRGAQVILLDVEPNQAVRAAIINGKRIEAHASKRDLWNLTYYAVPPDGLEITLELNASESITLQISDQTWDLVPEVLDKLRMTIQPRPTDMMPMPNFDFGTVVVRTIPLD